MKKISILIALACALMITGCAGGVKTGKPARDGLSGPRQEQKKSIAEQSAKTKAAMSAYTTKSTPVGADTFLISDSEAANATKKATLSSTKAALGIGTSDNPSFNSIHASGGNLAAANAQVTKKWITGLPYTANVTSVIYGGKHYICTSSHTADSTTEPGVGANWATVWSEVTGGGVSAWSDIQALLTGTGTYVKADGTTGDPTGTITTGDGVAAAMANALDGTGGLASKAALDALPNIIFGTGITVAEDTPSAGTDTVSIDADTTPTDGSAKPITSNAVFDALGGKENADATIVKSGEIDTQAKFEALTGWALPSGGVGGYVTAPVYSDSACTTGTYSFHATYGVVYCKATNTWDYQVVSGSSLAWASWSNLTPVTYTLTIDGTGWNGTDLISVGGSTYTADGTKTGLSGDVEITVTPGAGRTESCSGTGITGASSPYTGGMTDNRTIACTFSDGASYIHDILMDDNAATTVVSNDGTNGLNWIASHATNTLYNSSVYPSGYTSSFLFDENYNHIKSGDDWTSEQFEVVFYVRHQEAVATTSGPVFQIGDGDNINEANEIYIRRSSGSDELYICAYGASGSSSCQLTTDYNPSADTWYKLTITVDATANPWAITLKRDDTTVSMAGSFAAEPATFSSKMWLGADIATAGKMYFSGFTAEDKTP